MDDVARAEDFERPVDRVYRALPGTLRDLMERTGYPSQVVLESIRRLRSQGTVVQCVVGERAEEGWEPSQYLIRAKGDV